MTLLLISPVSSYCRFLLIIDEVCLVFASSSSLATIFRSPEFVVASRSTRSLLRLHRDSFFSLLRCRLGDNVWSSSFFPSIGPLLLQVLVRCCYKYCCGFAIFFLLCSSLTVRWLPLFLLSSTLSLCSRVGSHG
ncbi:uncharacterized protein LOC129303041 [Prosopis cineraria]|uniref:uncharacterized protein LOC129303041 n=1 Tax=Prosopis cineraria TaxID=364024 RepID=UPI002410AEA8|nr:uncharacterized protein LOC129303041 [Prosopis cineraria]